MASNKEFYCEYCFIFFSCRQSLSKHKYNYCKLIPEDIKQILKDKQNSRKLRLQQKHEAIIVRQSKEQSNIKTINNSNNSINHNKNTNIDNKQINITLVNICGNNVPEHIIDSIKELNEESVKVLKTYLPKILQPFGSENISKILNNSDQILKYFNNIPLETFSYLLNDIHQLDENRNFGVPNVKKAIVQYVNENYDISKNTKSKHINEIQVKMHSLYKSLYNRYKDEIRPYLKITHEEFIKFMLKPQKQIEQDFYIEEKMKQHQELEQKKLEAIANSEIFDDRSILNRPIIIPRIPDYYSMTIEIIETYLTTYSKLNIQHMSEHKETVCAIKSAINTSKEKEEEKKPVEIKTLKDFIEECNNEDKRKQAIEKIKSINFLSNSIDTPINISELQNTTSKKFISDKEKYNEDNKGEEDINSEADINSDEELDQLEKLRNDE